MTTEQAMLAALKRHFGYDAFLEGQSDVIEALLGGDDLCVVMPTGAGKSLCYQLPALMRPGYTLVISPLISLMKDQVDALNAKGIPAGCLNSTMSNADRQTVMDLWYSGSLKLLYVAPERLRTRSFSNAVKNNPPDFLVVDEAHCISQWGHDFRPDYVKLGDVIAKLQVPQVAAFTATATPVVREDIITQLQRPQMATYITGFTRPNLRFQVRLCSSQDDKLEVIRKTLADRKPTIIYAATRKNVDLLAEETGCLRYHAGLTDTERTEVQDRFISDTCPVIAATNAFGMGIDRPDVRRVIHFNTPGSLEAYYQEAGRAGRDGEDADCILLFSHRDRDIHEFLVDLNHPPEFVVHALWRELRDTSLVEQSDILELSLVQLAQRVPGAKGDKQISAALQVLEKHDYLERGFRELNRGLLKISVPQEQILAEFPKANTQRALFLHQILRTFGTSLENDGVACTMFELERVSRLSRERLTRVLRALHPDFIDWMPPFSGRGIHLLRLDAEQLDIDFKEMNHHKNLELTRLDDMFKYPVTMGCRQSFMVEYFGQEAEGWVCQVCDRCLAQDSEHYREPTPEERDVLVRALTAIYDLSGAFGKNRIAQYLSGGRQKSIIDSGLHQRRMYGALKHLDSATVVRLLESMLESGLLTLSSDNPRYPCLEVTSCGRRVMHENEKLKINFHSLRITGRKKSASDSSSDRNSKNASIASLSSFDDLDVDDGDVDDLYERLRKLRNGLAETQGVPPYVILSNKVLMDLAESRPVTIEEATLLKGIGPAKAKGPLVHFLAEISRWRKENC